MSEYQFKSGNPIKVGWYVTPWSYDVVEGISYEVNYFTGSAWVISVPVIGFYGPFPNMKDAEKFELEIDS